MEVIVRHLVYETIVGPILIEKGSYVDMGEFCSSFITRPSESENLNFRVGEDHLNSEDPIATFSTTPPFTTTPPFNTSTVDCASADGEIDVCIVGPYFLDERSSGF